MAGLVGVDGIGGVDALAATEGNQEGIFVGGGHFLAQLLHGIEVCGVAASVFVGASFFVVADVGESLQLGTVVRELGGGGKELHFEDDVVG